MNRVINFVFALIVIVVIIVLFLDYSRLGRPETIMQQIYFQSFDTWLYIAFGVLMIIFIFDSFMYHQNKANKKIADISHRLDLLVESIKKQTNTKNTPKNYEIECPHCKNKFDIEV